MTPNKPEPLTRLIEQGRAFAKGSVMAGNASKAWGRGAEAMCDWLLGHLDAARTPSQPDLRAAFIAGGNTGVVPGMAVPDHDSYLQRKADEYLAASQPAPADREAAE